MSRSCLCSVCRVLISGFVQCGRVGGKALCGVRICNIGQSPTYSKTPLFPQHKSLNTVKNTLRQKIQSLAKLPNHCTFLSHSGVGFVVRLGIQKKTIALDFWKWRSQLHLGWLFQVFSCSRTTESWLCAWICDHLWLFNDCFAAQAVSLLRFHVHVESRLCWTYRVTG